MLLFSRWWAKYNLNFAVCLLHSWYWYTFLLHSGWLQLKKQIPMRCMQDSGKSRKTNYKLLWSDYCCSHVSSDINFITLSHNEWLYHWLALFNIKCSLVSHTAATLHENCIIITVFHSNCDPMCNNYYQSKARVMHFNKANKEHQQSCLHSKSVRTRYTVIVTLLTHQHSSM